MAKIVKPIERMAQVPRKAMTDADIEVMEKEIQANFGGLLHRTDLERWWVRFGAGSFRQGVFHRAPVAFAIVEEKYEAWARWRQRKYPFDRMAFYAKWAEQDGHVPTRREVAQRAKVV